MKKTLVTLILFAAFLNLSALTPADQISITEKIKKEITYPETALENQEEGFVMVNFYVDTLGHITVNMVNSDNQVLSDYVIEKIESLTVPCTKEECHDYCIRVEFWLK